MAKSKKNTRKKSKEIIIVCKNAIKGKKRIDQTDLLSFFPILRSEIKQGTFEFEPIKALTLSSQVLDLKTRSLLGEFFEKDADMSILKFDNYSDVSSIEASLTLPINSFRDFIIENDIIDAYFELLKIKRIKQDYSVKDDKEIIAQEKNGFQVDSFEQDKNELFLKLTALNKKSIDFNTLQNNWEDAVINLIYLVHLAQDGKLKLEQKSSDGRILIYLNN